MLSVSSLSSDEESEEEIDTSSLLDTKNVDPKQNQDSKTNPYLIVNDKPYIVDLIQKSLLLSKYRVIIFGIVTSIWKILLLIGVILFLLYQNHCLSVHTWSKFTICILVYMVSTYLCIFLIDLYIWVKGKQRLKYLQTQNVKTLEMVEKVIYNESLVDLLRIGHKIDDVSLRRKMIKDICIGKNNSTVICNTHEMLSAIKKALKVSSSSVGDITTESNKGLYIKQSDSLVNNIYFIWMGIPMLTILIWICIATDIKKNVSETTTDDVFYLENMTGTVQFHLNAKTDCCNHLYIFNIIVMTMVSLQTCVSFIPFLLRIFWHLQ